MRQARRLPCLAEAWGAAPCTSSTGWAATVHRMASPEAATAVAVAPVAVATAVLGALCSVSIAPRPAQGPQCPPPPLHLHLHLLLLLHLPRSQQMFAASLPLPLTDLPRRHRRQRARRHSSVVPPTTELHGERKAARPSLHLQLHLHLHLRQRPLPAAGTLVCDTESGETAEATAMPLLLPAMRRPRGLLRLLQLPPLPARLRRPIQRTPILRPPSLQLLQCRQRRRLHPLLLQRRRHRSHPVSDATASGTEGAVARVGRTLPRRQRG
mmetsp:Transcript_2527/g.7451  ORF Transcript_2527/g.7451 Transcript_2527/m.7451 type:complete len:268 (+) Transcript_2527:665-1468(+)